MTKSSGKRKFIYLIFSSQHDKFISTIHKRTFDVVTRPNYLGHNYILYCDVKGRTMNTQFDITKVCNLIMKSFEREMLKEIPAESINDAVYRVWLKKQYVKSYKSMPAHIRLMCGLSDEMLFYRTTKRNIIRYEIVLDDFENTKEYVKICNSLCEEIERENEVLKEYEKYSQFYYNLYRLMLTQATVNNEKMETEEWLKKKQKKPNIIIEEKGTKKQEVILPAEYPEIWEQTICEKCPWMIPLLIMFQIVMAIITVKEVVVELATIGQEAIVKLEGQEDIFFVESEVANIYSEPTIHSDIVGKVYYSDKVKRMDSINMWNRFFYYDENGELVIGWIASKKLISYQEWKFNLDRLYEIGNE